MKNLKKLLLTIIAVALLQNAQINALQLKHDPSSIKVAKIYVDVDDKNKKYKLDVSLPPLVPGSLEDAIKDHYDTKNTLNLKRINDFFNDNPILDLTPVEHLTWHPEGETLETARNTLYIDAHYRTKIFENPKTKQKEYLYFRYAYDIIQDFIIVSLDTSGTAILEDGTILNLLQFVPEPSKIGSKIKNKNSLKDISFKFE